MNSSLRERFARLGPVRDVDRVPSGSPGVILLSADPLPGAVLVIDATLALAKRGVTMLRAKRALEAMLDSGTAVLAVPTIEDDAALRRDLAEAGVGVTAVPEVRPVDLAALRERLRMTREQFALAYGLDPETVRNWEAGRRDPGPARAYLQAIENDPQGVLDAFVGRSMERLPATP